MIQDKLRQKGMSRADAVEEVIADACEMVLKDSKAVEKLANENKSLARTIADWLHGFYEDIKAAFEGVEARSKEAKAMTDYMEELVKLWDDALIEASKVREINRAKLAKDWDKVIELEEAIYASEYADEYSSIDNADFERRDARERDYERSAKDLYRSTAGEIEARDTASRRTLTAEQRKNTRPDIDQEDVVFAEGSFISYSYDELSNIVDESISDKGFKGGKGRSEEIGKFSPLIVSMVKSASGGAIDISDKVFAVNRGEIFHAYRRHSKVQAEISKNQVPLKPSDIVDAIWAVQNPDVVEALFTTTNNPTQMLAFAYAKQTSDGHYIVIEAVGGKNNKNVTPVEIHKFTQNKWDKMISSGKTLGEVLYENDAKKFAALDVAANKNNRVFAAQFVRTNPASSAFSSVTSNIAQNDSEVKYSRRNSSEGLTKEEARAQAQAYTRLKAENAALQRKLEYWQGQTKRTKQRTINRGDVDKYARQLIKMHGNKLQIISLAIIRLYC